MSYLLISIIIYNKMFVNTLDETDTNLRPRTWDEYLGQKKLKDNLRIIIQAAKKRGESLEHLLFMEIRV